jgi:hypothetical protein
MIIETIIILQRSWKYKLKLHFYYISFDITKKASGKTNVILAKLGTCSIFQEMFLVCTINQVSIKC